MLAEAVEDVVEHVGDTYQPICADEGVVVGDGSLVVHEGLAWEFWCPAPAGTESTEGWSVNPWESDVSLFIDTSGSEPVLLNGDVEIVRDRNLYFLLPYVSAQANGAGGFISAEHACDALEEILGLRPSTAHLRVGRSRALSALERGRVFRARAMLERDPSNKLMRLATPPDVLDFK